MDALYIKQCDCPEIQDRWEPKEGDLLCCIDQVYIWQETDPITCNAHKNEGCWWLPRQDQLQGMIRGRIDLSCLENLASLKMMVSWDSMEQLWLAFVMHELHGKIWDSGKWIQENKDG